VGKYLNKGDLFATIENSNIAKVEIQVPQSDAVDVKMGAKTRLKVWTYPERIFEGKVVEISPVVEENDAGEVVVITTYAPNEDGLLQSGMTGFGKIDGGEKPVIVAFTRMFVLFFLVEIWSWLP
jgi:multidrug efflux pump subunit AcrA (membrane-fusion protein)